MFSHLETTVKSIQMPSTVDSQLNASASLDILISNDIPQKDILFITVSTAPSSGSEIVIGNSNFIVTDIGTLTYGKRLKAVYSSTDGNYELTVDDVEYTDTGDLYVNLIYKKDQEFKMEKSSTRFVVRGEFQMTKHEKI